MALNDYISKGEFDRRVKLIEEKLKFIKDDDLKNRLDELNEEYVDKLRHANFDINNLRSDLEEVVGEEGNIEALLNSFVTGYNNFTANTLRFNDVFDTDGQFTGKIRPLSVETAALSVGTRSQQLALNGVEFRVLPYSSGNGTLDIVSSTNSRTGTTTGVAGYMFHYGFGTDTDPKVYKINAESKPIGDNQPYYIYAQLPYEHNDVYTTVPVSFNEDSYKLHIGELYERTGSSPSYSYTKVLTYTSGTYYKNAGTSEKPIYSEVEIDQDNYFKNVFELYTKSGDTYTPLSLPEYDSNKTYCTKSNEDIITYDSSSADNNTAIIFIDKNQITLNQLSGYLTIKLGYISAELSTTNGRKERKVDMTYGSTTIDGRLITTGKIEGNGVSIDLDTGKVIGDLEIKSGNTSITMDQYLSSKYGEIYDYVLGDSTTGIQKIINDVKDDLEGQIDGRIDTWFGNVQPGPNVYPENEWTTTSDKDNHLGDLYYDDSTGYAYRYTKNGNNYTWSKIEDTDMTRALAIAKSAKETADGKMSVFLDDPSNPPIPPYSEGDMWVNATYPKTGTKTYNDETLVCIDRHFESCANASYSQSTIYYKIENNEYVVDDEVTSENFNTKKSSLYKQIFNIADWQSSNRAIAEVDNVTNDGIISKGSEKSSLKKEYEEISSTYSNIIQSITDFDVASSVTSERDALDAEYNKLNAVMKVVLGYSGSSINDSLLNEDTYIGAKYKGSYTRYTISSSNTITTSTITNSSESARYDIRIVSTNTNAQDFRNLWKLYYEKEAILSDKIQKAAQDKIKAGVAAAQGELSAIKDGTTTIAGGMITNNLLELKNITKALKIFDSYNNGGENDIDYYERIIDYVYTYNNVEKRVGKFIKITGSFDYGNTLDGETGISTSGRYKYRGTNIFYPRKNIYYITTSTSNVSNGVILSSKNDTVTNDGDTIKVNNVTQTPQNFKLATFHYGGGQPGVVTSGVSGIDNFPVFWAGGDEVQAANYIVFKKAYKTAGSDYPYFQSPFTGNMIVGYYNEMQDFIYPFNDENISGSIYPVIRRTNKEKKSFIKALQSYNTLIRTKFRSTSTGGNVSIDTSIDSEYIDKDRLPIVIIDNEGFCKFGDFYIYDNQAYYDNQSGFGHYKINLNGSDITPQGTLLGSFYAPTDYGTSGYVLKSNGINTAPSWIQTLPVANGGTNATTAANARANLGTWSLVSDSYNTLMPANGTSNGWVKIGTANSDYGIIPSQSGGAGSGHNYLGTSTWYWKYAYIDQIYGYLNGNISGSSTSCSGNAATATTATKLGTSSVGSTDKPIYLNSGVATVCGVFPTLNTTGEINITDNSDLNTYTTPGMYGTSGGYIGSSTAGSLLNKPTFNGGFRMSVQYGGYDNTYIRQIIYCKNGETFSREGYLSNNVWSWFDWLKILNSSNYSSYALPLSGGNMTGNIGYTGSKSTNTMITFINNTSDAYGNGIAIGGGGQTIIGGGESAATATAQVGNAGAELMYVCNDEDVNIISNLQSGWSYRKMLTWYNGYLGLLGDVTSSDAAGIYWHTRPSSAGTNSDYGIYKTAGSWASPNYQQLKLDWPTGIILDGGSYYGKSGVQVAGLLYINDYIRIGQGNNVIDGYRLSNNTYSTLHINYYSNGNTTLSYGGGNVGIGTNSPAYKLNVNGNCGISSYLGITQTSGDGTGLSLYGTVPSSGFPNYGVSFATTTTGGTFGDVTGDYATYFTMNTEYGTHRGWIFKTTNTRNVASISSEGNFCAYGGVTALATSSSDKRLKKNIKKFNATEIVEKLQPVSFEWNNKAKKYNNNFKDGKNYGLIAQDSDGIIDNLVFDLPDGKGYKGVRYEKLIPILLQAIKEQQKEINELKKLVKK